MVISAAVCSDTIVGELQIAPGLESLLAGLAERWGAGARQARCCLPQARPLFLLLLCFFPGPHLTWYPLAPETHRKHLTKNKSSKKKPAKCVLKHPPSAACSEQGASARAAGSTGDLGSARVRGWGRRARHVERAVVTLFWCLHSVVLLLLNSTKNVLHISCFP